VTGWRWSGEAAFFGLLEQVEKKSVPSEVVKSNPKRDVIRAGDLFLKRYRVTSRLERVKHVFVPSKAETEHENMRRLRAAGVATAEPLAWGEKRGAFLEECAFVSRAVPGAHSFARALDEARAGKGDRKALIEKLARLACAIARAGADHRDLHVGNVLLDQEERAVIIDLHAVSFPGVLDEAHRFTRLARLALSLGALDPERASLGREEVAWLAAAVSAEDPALGPADVLAQRLDERASALLARHLASRDRRCLVDSKAFAVEELFGKHVYRRRELAGGFELERVLAAPGDELLHRHARGRTTIERLGAVARKTEEYPSLRSRLGALLRGPRARDAWKGARALEVRELPHPRALALVEEIGSLALPRRSFLLMEHLSGTWMVHVYLQKVLGKGEPRKRQALARALGALVARLHARGVVHRDLAVQNILLRERAGPEFDLWFVDLEEVRVREPTEEDALRALVQVADLPPEASRTDLLRGFRAYVKEGGAASLRARITRGGEPAVIREISRRLVERARAKQHRAERRMRK
jgi:tRNA A-37 threonylcarbamoyl transferase component Bud32